MSLYKDIVELGFFGLDVQVDTWEQAIHKACEPLVEARKISSSYPVEIINNTKKYGPYYILMPGVAMPHGRPEQGVVEDCFSLTVLKEPVLFPDEDEPVGVLFTFGALNAETHLKESIVCIVSILENDIAMEGIRQAKTREDLQKTLSFLNE